MRPSELTKALRRDDLTFSHADVDFLEAVDCPWDRGDYDAADVALISPINAVDAVYQALVLVDDYSPEEGPTYIYVPLMFGPVREVSHAAE